MEGLRKPSPTMALSNAPAFVTRGWAHATGLPGSGSDLLSIEGVSEAKQVAWRLRYSWSLLSSLLNFIVHVICHAGRLVPRTFQPYYLIMAGPGMRTGDQVSTLSGAGRLHTWLTVAVSFVEAHGFASCYGITSDHLVVEVLYVVVAKSCCD